MSERVRTFLLEPFDILLHATEDGVTALQSRFSTWLRTLNAPARFLSWQMHATLDDKIAAVAAEAEQTEDDGRRALLIEYRREYERMNLMAEYQRALCGMALWNDVKIGFKLPKRIGIRIPSTDILKSVKSP